MKVEKDPRPLVCPNPVVLVTTVDANMRPNARTLTLVGAECGQLSMIGIGIGVEQHSRFLIDESGEFLVIIPQAGMLKDVENCGLVSGRDVEKVLGDIFYLCPF